MDLDRRDLLPVLGPVGLANFRPWRVVLRATVLAAVLCALFVANYLNGWITAEDIDIFGAPPDLEGPAR